MVTEQEIKHVIKSWSPNKATGPDSFTGEFYQSFMEILLSDIKQVFDTIMENPSITLHPLNGSHKVIIPKKRGAVLPSDFRPISIVHAMQIILSKILANILQPHRFL
jgi:hypothetical protein